MAASLPRQLVGTAILLGLAACTDDMQDWPGSELHEGGRIAAELGAEDVHLWRVPLDAGDFVRLVVQQEGVDVELTWRDPDGEVVLTADRILNDQGPEHVLAVAEEAGDYTVSIEALPGFGGGRYEARIETLRPATAEDRRAAETYRRFREVEERLGADEIPRDEAQRAWDEALRVWRELDAPVLEGEVLERQGRDHFDHRESAEAVDRYRRATEALERGGQRRWAAMARANVALNLERLGDAEATEEAVAEYRSVLEELAGGLDDPRLEAKVRNGLGKASRRLGLLQDSLTHYEAALDLVPEDDAWVRPGVLHNLGVLHSLYFHDPEKATELLRAARDGWSSSPVYERSKSITLNQLGRVALEQGRLEDARDHFEASLEAATGQNPCDRALTLARLARIEETVGRADQAGVRRDQALEALRGETCPPHEASVRLVVAALAEMRGNRTEALEGFETVRKMAEGLRDRTLEAEALVGIARVRRARGDPESALEASDRALDLAQGVRPTVLRNDLRTAFFATVQDRFDLHIALLSELDRHEEAWTFAEAARARALRDLLAEAGAGLRQAAAPEQVERERALRRRLSYAQSRSAPNREEIDSLVEELERVRAEIRARSPRYADLARSRPLTVADVQREVLDEDTLVLEYRLGGEESRLWVLGATTFSAHVLPPRAEIEPLAREAAAWLRSPEWPGETPEVLCELSRRVLGPVASDLESRRLVLVLDGALESVPFAALPDPREPACSEASPLVARHEIVQIPSVETLYVQRRRRAERPSPRDGVAVMADPVYGPEDPRLEVEVRSDASERSGWSRLVHSGREAEAIRELSPNRVTLAVGFDASKRALLDGSLRDRRILHFAVHGELHPNQPLLSHLVLSRFRADGEPVEGSLYAHEIYDLDVAADLVVLSACDTARGRWVPGEGLIAGLPRAFLYAGSSRVLMSLWAAPDHSTADLMESFYRRLLLQGQAPSRALHEAQRELWRAGRAPWEWAGFTFLGDWRTDFSS